MQLSSKFENYLGARSFSFLRMRSLATYAKQVDRTRRPIVVLQMGKVGSSSVVKTLQDSLPGHFVHHVHFLSQPWLGNIEKLFEDAGKVAGRHRLHAHVSAARYLMNNFDDDAAGKPKLIVSLMRDPIARNISSFFQAFAQYYPEANHNKNSSGSLDALPTEELIEMFIEGFGEQRHRMPLIWFDEHIKENFGLDIFAHDFDSERGFSILENDACRLLLMTMEKLPSCLHAGVNEFTGTAPVIPQSANVSSDKKYGPAYKQFLDKIRLPSSYIEEMYSSKVVNYFYNEPQIAQFRERWSSTDN